jgi:hypothetical protein
MMSKLKDLELKNKAMEKKSAAAIEILENLAKK